MDQISTTTTTLKVSLADGLLHNSQTEATRIGISVQDFIRLLLASYFAQSESLTAIKRDKALIERAQQELATRQYTEFKSSAKFQEHLLNLEREDNQINE